VTSTAPETFAGNGRPTRTSYRPAAGPRRGQALVLFSLLMLSGLLMAFMTISLTERAKERLELQAAADHAAWSNAVATARMMNGVALLVRSQIAHYVAVAGVQSLVSFAGSYRGYLTGMEQYYERERDRQDRMCNSGRACGCVGRAELRDRRDLVRAEHDRIRTLWDALDAMAGEQIYGATLVSMGILATQREYTNDLLIEQELRGATLADSIAKREGGGRKWSAMPVDGINLREVGGSAGDEGAVIGRQHGHTAHLWATMGTRGNPFTAARRFSHLAIEQALRRVTRTNEPVVFGHEGTSYFSSQFHGNTKWTVSDKFAWADDHGVLAMRYAGGGCNSNPRAIPISGSVKSTDTTDDTDFHTWSPQLPQDRELGVRHTSSTCTARICPAMFFSQEDYNPNTLPVVDDVFAQPKNYAVLSDDRTARRPDPWNLFFRFQFSRGSSGVEVDWREGVARNGLDFRTSTAIAAGIAYYHRRGHWKEPPNLYNPYWRAGLVRADVDDQARRRDLAAAIAAGGNASATDAFRKLHAAGYRGIP